MNFLAVFMGGGTGALVRYLLYLVMPSYAYLPLATLVANFFGCFIATVVFVYFAFKSDLNQTVKIFLITGFCGGLSTLSALSLELLHFIHSGEYLRAAIYVFSTVIICTGAVLLGVLVAKLILAR